MVQVFLADVEGGALMAAVVEVAGFVLFADEVVPAPRAPHHTPEEIVVSEDAADELAPKDRPHAVKERFGNERLVNTAKCLVCALYMDESNVEGIIEHR